MANMFRYWCCSSIYSVPVFIRVAFYGQPFDRWNLSCVPSFATWGASFVVAFTLDRCKRCVVSAFLTHALHILSTGISDYSRLWRGDWRNSVLSVTSETYLDKWIATSVGYTYVASALLFCILAQVQRRCTPSCWWMSHTATKQHLQHPQPSVWSGVHVDDIVQQRGTYPRARGQLV